MVSSPSRRPSAWRNSEACSRNPRTVVASAYAPSMASAIFSPGDAICNCALANAFDVSQSLLCTAWGLSIARESRPPRPSSRGASSRGASSERTSFKIANFFAAYAFTAVASPPTGGLSVLLFSSSARNFCCCSEKTRLTTSVSAPPLAPLAAFVFAPPPPAAAAYDRRAHATTRRRNIPARSRPVLATSRDVRRRTRRSSPESRVPNGRNAAPERPVRM